MLFIIVQSWVGLVLVKFESFLGFLRWEFLSDVQIYDDESDWIHSFKIVTTNEAFVWEELLRFPNRRLFCFICFVLFIFIFLGKILGVYGWDLGIVMMTRKIIWWIFDDFLTSYSYWMSALNNCRLSPMKIWEKKDFFFWVFVSCCCCSVFLVWWVFCFRFVSVSAMLLLIVLQVLLREEDDCGRDDKTILLSQYCFEEHPVIVFQALLSCSLPLSLSPSLFLSHQLKHLCFD